MKFIQKTKIIIILLIFVTLLFALLGTLNLYSVKEGLSQLVDCSGDIVPTCSTEVNDFDADTLQYYALKTELVPPICPNCPYYADISYGSYHNSSGDNSSSGTSSGTNSTKIKGDNNNLSTNTTDVNIGNETNVDQSTKIDSTSDFSNIQEDNSNVNVDNSVDQNINTTTKQNINQDNSQKNTQDNSQDNSQKVSADNKWNNLFGNNSISFGGGKNNSNIQTTGNNSQGAMAAGTGAGSGPGGSMQPYAQGMGGFNSSPFMLQQGAYLQGPDLETTNMINNLKQKVDLLMNQNPPTISNNHYPEQSAFDCKKVPNYRSNGNIPLPILNDFSRF
jgi:hypothetical protein